MGCCASSPYSRRVYYRDPADLDELEVPAVRTFGTLRAGSNLVPDDCGALPSPYWQDYLATNTDLLLYEAEVDQGYGFRCLRLEYACLFCPWGWVYLLSKGLTKVCEHCTCDEACCWVRKEYGKRSFYRVYPNRVAVNHPKVRWPWGYCGCGSWNADDVLNHPFDRGAFGFSVVHFGVIDYFSGHWPVYGGTVARHRCQCNGPLWNRMFTDCGGWWCEEWPCKMCCCTYRYPGIANPDEVAFASAIALQAYFEGRPLTREDMTRCVEFWRENLSEAHDPIGRKRPVCCEPSCAPCCTLVAFHRCTHKRREIPYDEDKVTPELLEAYADHNELCERQRLRYESFEGPVRRSTICRVFGCRRVFGAKGCCFCTEGCAHCGRRSGEPAPPREVHDLDDEFDASTVLLKVLGPPPPNVAMRRWRFDPELGQSVLDVYPAGAEGSVPQVNDKSA